MRRHIKVKVFPTVVITILMMLIITGIFSSIPSVSAFSIPGLDPGDGGGGGADPLEWYNGYVKDQFNRKVSGAKVVLLEDGINVISRVTASDGYYLIKYQTDPSKEYKLRVSKDGYFARTVNVPAASKLTYLTIFYNVNTQFTGDVYFLDRNNEIHPLVGADVRLYDEIGIDLDINDTTDEFGRYSFRISNTVQTQYRIDVIAENYSVLYEVVSTGTTSETKVIDFQMDYDLDPEDIVYNGGFYGSDVPEPGSLLEVLLYFRVYKSQRVEFRAEYIYWNQGPPITFCVLSLCVHPSEYYMGYKHLGLTDEECLANDTGNSAGPVVLYGTFDDYAWLAGSNLMISGVLTYMEGPSLTKYAYFELTCNIFGNGFTIDEEIRFTGAHTDFYGTDWIPPL